MAKQESKQEIRDENQKWGDDPSAPDRFEFKGTEKKNGKIYVEIGDEVFELDGETIFTEPMINKSAK